MTVPSSYGSGRRIGGDDGKVGTSCSAGVLNLLVRRLPLRGTIAVADADNLRFLIRILRVAAVFPFVLAGVAIVVGLLSRSIQMNMVAFGIGIGAVASIGLSYLQRSGERAAAIDARWLLEKVAALE
jgi:hypothetical protein